MKTVAGYIVGAALLCASSGVAFAQNTPYHNETANIVKPTSENHPLYEIVSGIDFRQPQIREMWEDDFSNPGMLSYETGDEVFHEPMGTANASLADVWQECAGVSVEEAGHTYPRYHDKAGKVITIEQQVNYCLTEVLGAEKWKWESPNMLGVVTYIRHSAKGEPMMVAVDGSAAETFEKGKELYYQRVGQLDMSCAHCHEGYYGNRIRADMLSQGQINGFPTYRIKWNGIGSIHRRFRGCNNNIRATKLAYGHEDYVALELYLAWRGQGLPIEAPAVRQ